MKARHVLTAALVLSAAVLVSSTTADPDLWGHVRFGQDIVAMGALHDADPYSFTSDRPWVNHEWLAEVMMALAYETAGSTGLNILRLVVIVLVLALVWGRLHAVDWMLRAQLVAATAFGIVLRVHPVRPQLFSVLLFAVLLTLICRADERGSMRSLWWVPLVMAAWVNLHGGWIVGLGVLGAWIAGRTVTRNVPGGRPILVVGLGLAALAATLINPYGLGMWRFLAATVRVERPMINDWQPLYALAPAFAALWLVPAGVAVLALTRQPRWRDWMSIGLVALLGVAALRVSRLDAFFMLAVVFLLASRLRRCHGAHQTGPRLQIFAAAKPAFAATAVAAVLVVGWRLPDVEVRPEGNPEPEAAKYVRDHDLRGRMLTWFDWGQYAIWHLSPGIKVSMDGRRETVYSDSVVSDHLHFYAGGEGAVSYPERIGADYVWLPRTLPIVPELLARGWRPLFEGPVSVVLTRGSHSGASQSMSAAGSRVFPSL